MIVNLAQYIVKKRAHKWFYFDSSIMAVAVDNQINSSFFFRDNQCKQTV